MTTFPLEGDCLEILRSLDDNSVDAVVTDPPYGLAEHKPAALITALTAWAAGDREHVPDGKGFMGRDWDAFVPPPAVWDECLRVLKPGGYLLAFAGSRTADLMGLSVRMAGFEIRDGLQWIYGSGMPKGKAQLKPSHEPIVLARKPCAGSMKANVARFGTGGLEIEACRVAVSDRAAYEAKCASVVGLDSNRTGAAYGEWSGARTDSASATGRWPSNVVLTHHPDCADPGPCTDGCPVAELDQQSGTLHSQNPATRASKSKRVGTTGFGTGESVEYGDSGGASRFFPVFRYQAKAPAKERPEVDGVKHPTVKPLALMQWLVRLVTPPGGLVLDPFAGSGTTLEAARAEGFDSLGIERDPAYYQLILARLGYLTDSVEVAS